MGAHRSRSILVAASVCLAVLGSGCARGGTSGAGSSTVTAAEVVSTDPSSSTTRDVDSARKAESTPERGATAPASAGSDPASSEVTRSRTLGPSRTPTAGATTPVVPTPTASLTAVPNPSYSPYTMCPEIGELNPRFTAKRLGVDPQLGTDIVEVTFTYTNPLGHALFLMGSIGYVDSGGYESDLYARPGGLVFDDVRLERGTHTIVLQLEDLWGEAVGASIYFTYWSLAGTALDSSRPVPCEPSRGYSSH